MRRTLIAETRMQMRHAITLFADGLIGGPRRIFARKLAGYRPREDRDAIP